MKKGVRSDPLESWRVKIALFQLAVDAEVERVGGLPGRRPTRVRDVFVRAEQREPDRVFAVDAVRVPFQVVVEPTLAKIISERGVVVGRVVPLGFEVEHALSGGSQRDVVGQCMRAREARVEHGEVVLDGDRDRGEVREHRIDGRFDRRIDGGCRVLAAHVDRDGAPVWRSRLPWLSMQSTRLWKPKLKGTAVANAPVSNTPDQVV